jgi:hypothetical protein
MTDQNLPNQAHANQMTNTEEETMSDQPIPDQINPNNTPIDNLYVTGKVGIGISDSQNRLHVVAPGGFPNNVPIVAQSVSTFFGARDSDGIERFAINLDSDGTSYAVNFYDKYQRPWRRSISLKLGNVGIGTTDPKSMLHIGDGLPTPPSGGYRPWMVRGTLVSWDTDNVFFGLKDEGPNRKDAVIAWGDDPDLDVFRFIFTAHQGPANGQEVMRLESNGDLKAAGDVYAKDVQLQSSRELKENVAELSASEAVEALEDLNPVKFNFKADSDKNLHIGFIAEEVPDLVATSDRKTLSPMDIVAVLTQVVKQQQKTMAALAEKVKLLEAQTA